MSLHIYISHNGDHLLADPVSFASYVPPSLHSVTPFPLWVCIILACVVMKLYILLGFTTNLANLLSSARTLLDHGLPGIRQYPLKGKY